MTRQAGRDTSAAVLDGLVSQHRRLLEDRGRRRAFERALARSVEPGQRVLDIGAGFGIWSIAAARLGASVVAIEREAALIPLIEAFAREAGVSDRVRVVHGEAERVDLPRSFDLIVSETVGNLGFDEHIDRIAIDARRRFLVPGGRFLPGRIALLAAPARRTGRKVLAGSGPLHDLAQHFSVVPAGERIELLAPPRVLVAADLRRLRRPVRLHGLEAAWRVSSLERLQYLAVWVRIDVVPGIRVDTLSSSSWRPVLYPVEPATGRGRVAVTLDLDPNDPRWTLRVGPPGRCRATHHGATIAHAWWRAQQSFGAGEA